MIEILFSLLFLGAILHLSQVIFFQTNQYNQAALRLKALSDLLAQINFSNNEQSLKKPFSIPCTTLNQNSFSSYNFFICKIKNREVYLWKKQ